MAELTKPIVLNETAQQTNDILSNLLNRVITMKGDPGDPGEPGDKGDPGYTPVKGVDYFDGHTPVKGTDYFTTTEINNIKNEVKSSVESEIDIPTKTSDLTNDSGYITSTDYASATEGGVIKTHSTYGTSITTSGALYGVTRTLVQYESCNNGLFISKGTLDTILAQYMKSQALTQAEYDSIIEKDNNTLYVIVE